MKKKTPNLDKAIMEIRAEDAAKAIERQREARKLSEAAIVAIEGLRPYTPRQQRTILRVALALIQEPEVPVFTYNFQTLGGGWTRTVTKGKR